MLNELTDLQTSDEEVWRAAELSFEIETQLEEDGKLVRREYTFSYAKEWDKWTFVEFDEQETPNVSPARREWRRTRHIYWNDGESATIEVPPEVTRELEEMLDLDRVILQQP